MRHICYTSLAPAMDRSMFEAVMEAACRRNRDRDICGIIAFRDGVVTQIVEGDERVDDLFERISSDTRHSNVLLVSRTRISERSFKTFRVGLMDPLDIAIQSIAIARSKGIFDPAYVHRAHRFAGGLAALSATPRGGSGEAVAQVSAVR
ncbi:MAG: BLUF domain-containing protein [Fulvimarina manganoxydans]|uniref:BLUF domain-containing protein n=1 Tax=Fulvimarina manganoxydans TaxID=937218 RepID=UPI002355FEC5|nr:BLUF domain-containing protein [Fulvimarina manganoxydans]MCK5932461.1 BLUF domain-containing protein [Fulvimarina manganoxydans]